MGRLLAGVSGALFGAAIFAASAAAPAAVHGGWLPTLGALALGGLLGALFGGSGFGAAFVITLVVVAAVVALRVFGKTRREPAAPLQFAGPGANIVAAPKDPAGFDAEGLLRCAKLNYAKLQAARELGWLEPVREFTTIEMYHRLEADSSARPFDVVELNAHVLEVGAEAGRQQARVRFSGMAHAAPGAAPVGFVEIWSLAKAAGDTSGWLLAGIQQTS